MGNTVTCGTFAHTTQCYPSLDHASTNGSVGSLTSRRLSVLILKEVKSLLKLLGCSDNVPVIDVLDQNCAAILDRCLSLIPPAEKATIQAAANVDFQW